VLLTVSPHLPLVYCTTEMATLKIALPGYSLRLIKPHYEESRSQWPRGLRCSSTAARLLRLWVRIPPGAWISVCCECCVLSGRGLCDGLITRPEKSYRLWCVLCDLETSIMIKPWPTGGCGARNKQTFGRKWGMEVECFWKLIAHGDAGRGSEGENGEWSG